MASLTTQPDRRAYKKAWRIANKERLRAYDKAWRSANKERARAAIKAWNAVHPEVLAEARRRWMAANPERVRAYKKAWRDANTERSRQGAKAWQAANPERMRASNARRRARLASVRSTLTAEEWEAILEAAGYACIYCGCSNRLEQDHLTPISKGGEHTAENVAPACKPCNSSKGTKTAAEFLEP